MLSSARGLLICQRRPQDPHPLKWEFPGGKVQAAESEAECLRRELREELGIEADTYANGQTVALTFFHVPAYRGEIQNRQFHTVTWVLPCQLLAYDFLEGDLAFVTALARGTWADLLTPPAGR